MTQSLIEILGSMSDILHIPNPPNSVKLVKVIGVIAWLVLDLSENTTSCYRPHYCLSPAILREGWKKMIQQARRSNDHGEVPGTPLHASWSAASAGLTQNVVFSERLRCPLAAALLDISNPVPLKHYTSQKQAAFPNGTLSVAGFVEVSDRGHLPGSQNEEEGDSLSPVF